MDKVDFKLWDLKVQLGQFAPTEDSKGVPFGKIIKTLQWFEKNDQKLFMSEVLKLAKLLLVMPANNARVIIFSMKHIRTFFRNTTIGIRFQR